MKFNKDGTYRNVKINRFFGLYLTVLPTLLTAIYDDELIEPHRGKTVISNVEAEGTCLLENILGQK